MEVKREGPFWDVVDGKIPPPPAAELLGWKVLQVDPEKGTIRVEFEAKRAFLNPVGNVQGGILAAMLDDTMGPALVATLPPGHFTPTLELKTNFIRPAKLGKLIGVGKVVHQTKSVGFLEGALVNEDGDLVATATATVRIVRMEPEKEKS